MKLLNATILVVDDDEVDLLFIQSAFKKIGAASNIQTVNGGREAIKYLLGEGKFADRSIFAYPDFIITDLKMPGVSGFELIQFCRRDPNSATIPIVVFSGSQDNDDIRTSYLLGANSYHEKPSSPDGLRELLRALHSYWMMCKLPVENRGPKALDGQKALETPGLHKLGAQIESTAPWFRNPGPDVTTIAMRND